MRADTLGNLWAQFAGSHASCLAAQKCVMYCHLVADSGYYGLAVSELLKSSASVWRFALYPDLGN